MDAKTDTHPLRSLSLRSRPDLLAIVDVGKTNTKLVLLEIGTGRIAWHAERPTRSPPVPNVRELDVAGIEQWIITTLARTPNNDCIRALVPIAHGAAAVLLDAQGHVLAAPDYEDPSFEKVAEAYRERRDAYASTFSPWLALGLNLGRQLFFLQTRRPELFARTTRILTFPQYWAARFSGVAASEVTSLGCHTDLWHPVQARYSMLAEREGWSALFAPLRAASDELGKVTPEFASATGLRRDCRVLCGIHDSNASYLAHAATRRHDRELAVVSSGTWTVVMADRGSLDHLHESRDMLANVDAFGAPVATARFMGGREYVAIAGLHGMRATPCRTALDRVLETGAIALPCFADAGGPFAGRQGRIVNAEKLSAEERASLATLYLALMTDLRLDELQAGGSIVVDGPLATNPIFARILGALRPSADVGVSDARLASCSAAHFLATGALLQHVTPDRAEPVDSVALLEYRERWRREVAQP
jgi:sugar (pentulose or hexulose) kinase